MQIYIWMFPRFTSVSEVVTDPCWDSDERNWRLLMRSWCVNKIRNNTAQVLTRIRELFTRNNLHRPEHRNQTKQSFSGWQTPVKSLIYSQNKRLLFWKLNLLCQHPDDDSVCSHNRSLCGLISLIGSMLASVSITANHYWLIKRAAFLLAAVAITSL